MPPSDRYNEARDLLTVTQGTAKYLKTARRMVETFLWDKASTKFTKAERLLTLARLVHTATAALLAAQVEHFAAMVTPEASEGGLKLAEKRATQALQHFVHSLTMFDRERIAQIRRMARRGLWKKPVPKRHPEALEMERRDRHFTRHFARHGDDSQPPPYVESRRIVQYRERRRVARLAAQSLVEARCATLRNS